MVIFLSSKYLHCIKEPCYYLVWTIYCCYKKPKHVLVPLAPVAHAGYAGLRHSLNPEVKHWQVWT